MNSSHENDKPNKFNHDNDFMALEVRNLYKFWDSQAGRVMGVTNISFGVRKGEFVSIVGPSGSGKSTLLNMLGALERPSSGQVLINGIDIFSMNDSQADKIRI
jgi:putative ABC transport system ATP-binding protein